MAVKTDRTRIRVNNIETAYLDVGQGEPIVALHGIPTSSLLFVQLASSLPDYRLIAPDLLGQGETQEPSEGVLGYERYAAHVREFLREVPPTRFNLLVHDLGGVLGLEWAAENKERVKSLIILSTTVTGSIRVSKMLYGANLVFGRSLLRFGMQSTLKRSRRLDGELINEWARPWTRRRLLRGTDHFAGKHLVRVRSKLDLIEAPALIVWGEQDGIFPLQHARHIASALPQSKLITVPRCGHWLPLDAPEEFAEIISSFLTRR